MPDLVCLNDYSGDPVAYIDAVYKLFKKDFLDDGIQYNGLVVDIIKGPYFQEKEFTFWHIITEGKKEDERTPDMERCKRICWPKVVVENSGHRNIKVWEVIRRKKNRGKQRRICICYGNWEYLVILNIRSNKYLFCTAYPVFNSHTKRKSKTEYLESEKTKNAP